MSEKLSKDELERALLTLEIVYREANLEKPEKTLQAIGQIKSLIKAQVKPSEEWIEEKAKHVMLQLGRSYTLFDMKNLIRNLLKEAPMRKPKKPKVSREWIYYFCAYINAGHKSHADDEARVDSAIKKFKEVGVEVEE